MNLDIIKNKLAKMLRLSKSNNPNEAANALTKFQTLCREYGIAPTDVSQDFDPDRDAVVEFGYGRKFKQQDTATNQIINGVASYFNGKTIIANSDDHKGGRRQVKVMATKGNRIQIEIYAEYLLEVMEDLSIKAKKERISKKKETPRVYRTNWKKGFASQICKRLREMKREQEKAGIPETNTPAIVLINRNAMERRSVERFLNDTYPYRRRGTRSKIGYGFYEGSDAATAVSIYKQTSGSTTPTLALTGS